MLSERLGTVKASFLAILIDSCFRFSALNIVCALDAGTRGVEECSGLFFEDISCSADVGKIFVKHAWVEQYWE